MALSEIIIASGRFLVYILRKQGFKISKVKKVKNNVQIITIKTISGQMGCYLMVAKAAVSWLNWRVEHRKGK